MHRTQTARSRHATTRLGDRCHGYAQPKAACPSAASVEVRFDGTLMVHRLETVIRMDFVKTERPCHGRSRTLQTAANGWPHSHMSPECGRHLCHETACRVRERQGSVGPDGADDAFLSLVLRKCTIYSHN